jgi:Na+/H+-dicarboxylate symporter
VLIPTVAPLLAAVGIPTSMALVVLATTDNIIGPVRTALTLQSNITLTVMTARPGKEIRARDLQDGHTDPETP